MMGLLRALGLLLLLFCSGCFGSSESKEFEVGLRGLAASNPYLGAQRLAEELGYEGRGTTMLSQMPPTDWVMLMRDGVMLGGEAQALKLLRWARAGGDLWIDLGNESIWSEDGDEAFEEGPSEWALYKLLEELEVDVVDNEGARSARLTSAHGLNMPWPEGSVVLGAGEQRLSDYWGRRSHAALLHLPWGAGSVHFFASLHGFDNQNLRDHDWAELFEHLMLHSSEHGPAKGILVVYGGDGGSFLALLWQHTSYFLLALGLLTVVWLWRISRRFGPVREDPSWDSEGVGIGGGREFREHIVAAGRTYERRGQLSRLLRAADGRAGNDNQGVLQESTHTSQTELNSLKAASFLKQIKALQASTLDGDRASQPTTNETENDHE